METILSDVNKCNNDGNNTVVRSISSDNIGINWKETSKLFEGNNSNIKSRYTYLKYVTYKSVNEYAQDWSQYNCKS